MTTDSEIGEVVARVRQKSLAVCENCGGEGYTDMGRSACATCLGAGVTTPEMLAALASDTAATAARVCHDEQMEVWSGEVVASLAMGGYLRDDLSYEDTIHIHATVAADLRSIIASALAMAAPPDDRDLCAPGKMRADCDDGAPKGPWTGGVTPVEGRRR